jgi:rubredoxin
MPSEYFYCPQCRRQLKKSAQAYVLGEMFSGGGSGIMMGDMPPNVTCPGCGAAIDAEKMIRGEYDGAGAGKWGWAEYLGLFIWAAAWIVIVNAWDAPWWAGLLGGLAAALALSMLISTISKRLKRAKS